MGVRRGPGASAIWQHIKGGWAPGRGGGWAGAVLWVLVRCYKECRAYCSLLQLMHRVVAARELVPMIAAVMGDKIPTHRGGFTNRCIVTCAVCARLLQLAKQRDLPPHSSWFGPCLRRRYEAVLTAALLPLLQDAQDYCGSRGTTHHHNPAASMDDKADTDTRLY